MKFHTIMAIYFPIYQVEATFLFEVIFFLQNRRMDACQNCSLKKQCYFCSFWYGLLLWSVDCNDINLDHMDLKFQLLTRSNYMWFGVLQEKFDKNAKGCRNLQWKITMFIKTLRFPPKKKCRHVLRVLQCSYATVLSNAAIPATHISHSRLHMYIWPQIEISLSLKLRFFFRRNNKIIQVL